MLQKCFPDRTNYDYFGGKMHKVEYEMRVLKKFKDPLSRQVSEAVLMKNHRGELLNSKAEFHQPPLVRIRSEIIRGLEN